MRHRNATAPRAGSIAARVRALAVACIVPAWALAVVVLYQSHEREREALVQSTVLSARALAKGVDREIATSLSVLQTLAESPLIDDRDYPRLHAAGQQVLRNSGADNIVLFDTQLRGLVSLAHPPDAVLPTMKQDRFPEVMSSRRPAVSDLFVGQVSGKPQVAVAVPVLRQERVIGRLEMVFSAERLGRVLEAQQVRDGWTVGIFDRQGVLVARNREARQYVGRTVPATLRDAAARGPEGHARSRTQDGIDVIACYSHAAETGWTAVIGIPEAELNAALRGSLLKQGAGALVLLGLGLALAQWMGRRLARPLQALVPAALAVGRGEVPPDTHTGLREADEVGAALGQASRLLQEREQARAEAEQSLRDSEARLRHVLDAAQIGDWSLDVRTGKLEHSLRHDQCFGYASPVADWSMDTFLAHVHPDDRNFMAARVAEQMSQGQPFVQEMRVVWPDGSTHWIRGHGVPVVRDGAVTHVQGLVIDITDRRQAEELRLHGLRLEAENRQIQEANRLKSEFLANMSHELRTPLNAVIGFADILLQMADTVPEARRRDYLQHIGDSGRHLLRMINDVLDLSKVEAGRFEIYPEPLRLQPLVREVCGVLQAEFARKRIQLHTHLDPAVDELVLDPARLKQMLYNYLSNAIKFTPEGGSVTLRARPEGAQALRIEVEDNGIGIAPDDLPKLFSQFQQLQSGLTKAHAGTGLGLVLTLKLAQLHGGTAGVRSRLGEGSVFHIVLPRQAAPQPGAAVAGSPALREATAPEATAPPIPAPGAPCVLVVEDDSTDRAQLLDILRRAGYQVDLAATGREAVQRSRERRYDAITLDLLLPDRSGLDVLAELRSTGENQDVPVVVVTCVTERSTLAGFAVSDVLTKPIRPEQVTGALRRAGCLAGPHPVVLVVDDDLRARELMAAALQPLGVSVVQAADGREALLCLQQRVDAVILDLVMPQLNGFDLLHELRSRPETRALPVFIWTSLHLSDVEMQSLTRSASAVTSKDPAALSDLLERLRAWRAAHAT